jgi:phosphoglycolate phosphatase
VLVIFDFDGTLVNSLPDIAAGANYALRKNGFPVYSLDRYATFVGSGLNKLFERALPEDCKTPEWIRKVRTDYDDYYREHSLDQTKPYEVIVSLLADLKAAGIRLAVLSNKAHEFALPMVNAIFPAPLTTLLDTATDTIPN